MKKTPSNRATVVNIIVLRVNKLGELGMSQPCCNCIKKMEKFQEYKNCKINKIFFSQTSTSMCEISFQNIKSLPKHYSTAFKKK